MKWEAVIEHDQKPDNVVVVICNYDFNDNACKLKQFFTSAFATILIDGSSPTPAQNADLIIPNDGYRGLWNAAAKLAIDQGREWLFFIASDVELIRAELLIEAIRDASRDSQLAMWTPSVSADSRHAFRSCMHRPTSMQRICGVPEGFCFMIRTSILRRQYPVSASNRFGWKIDMASASMAHSIGSVVVDDRVMIFHPPARDEHQIDEVVAQQLGDEYLSTLAIDHQVMQDIYEIEYLPFQGMATPEYGSRRSLELNCGPIIRDPFVTDDAWGVDMIGRASQWHKVRSADLVVEAIPFEKHSFDHICSFNTLTYFPRVIYIPQRRLPLVELMNEIHRVLKPGGLFLSVCAASPSPGKGQDSFLENNFTDRTLADEFCKPNLSAAIHGFRGNFLLEHQCFQEDGRLLTLMRSMPTLKIFE